MNEGNYMFLKTFEEKLVNMGETNVSMEHILDYIFDTIDDLLLQNNFCKVDYVLNNIDVSKFEEMVLLGLLTVTYPWKKTLSLRNNFYDRIEIRIHELFSEDIANNILYGLKY